MTQMIITFSSFNVAIAVYIPIKQIFKKDNHNKIYGKISFYMASLFYLFPFFVVVFSIIINIFYWLSDLNKDRIDVFIWYWAILLVGGYFHSIFLGIMVGIIAENRTQMNILASVMLLPFFIVSGFFA
jgi:hypothetical protein